MSWKKKGPFRGRSFLSRRLARDENTWSSLVSGSMEDLEAFEKVFGTLDGGVG